MHNSWISDSFSCVSIFNFCLQISCWVSFSFNYKLFQKQSYLLYNHWKYIMKKKPTRVKNKWNNGLKNEWRKLEKWNGNHFHLNCLIRSLTLTKEVWKQFCWIEEIIIKINWELAYFHSFFHSIWSVFISFNEKEEKHFFWLCFLFCVLPLNIFCPLQKNKMDETKEKTIWKVFSAFLSKEIHSKTTRNRIFYKNAIISNTSSQCPWLDVRKILVKNLIFYHVLKFGAIYIT